MYGYPGQRRLASSRYRPRRTSLERNHTDMKSTKTTIAVLAASLLTAAPAAAYDQPMGKLVDRGLAQIGAAGKCRTKACLGAVGNTLLHTDDALLRRANVVLDASPSSGCLNAATRLNAQTPAVM